MPKKQTRAAHLARQIQTVTGLSYTTCLKMCEPGEGSWTALARELHAASLIEAADNLLGIAAVSAEATAWFDAGAEAQSVFYDSDYDRAERTSRACFDAAEAALSRAGFQTASFDTEAEAYHCAFLALATAGTVSDGRPLARAAVNVLDGDPLYCSDVVRARGRSKFTYATAADLSGPDTPYAAAARKAARALAAASAVRTGGDEGWYEAAEHMVEVVWYGCVAAGLPPLHESREHQDFFHTEMGGTLPTE